jgi:quercetin dioxygenase-like cupin family protein
VTEAERLAGREGAPVQGLRAIGNSLVIANFPGTLTPALNFDPSSQPDLPAPFSRITLRDLFHVADWQEEIPWHPFRKGVDIHRLYGDGVHGPTAALLRFREAGHVPTHEHTGWEHILVLSGTQRDDNGTTAAGDLNISPPGSQHSIVSEAGCIVLAIYEKPVKFLSDE